MTSPSLLLSFQTCHELIRHHVHPWKFTHSQSPYNLRHMILDPFSIDDAILSILMAYLLNIQFLLNTRTYNSCALNWWCDRSICSRARSRPHHRNKSPNDYDPESFISYKIHPFEL
jgi:hypothetical protein